MIKGYKATATQKPGKHTVDIYVVASVQNRLLNLLSAFLYLPNKLRIILVDSKPDQISELKFLAEEFGLTGRVQVGMAPVHQLVVLNSDSDSPEAIASKIIRASRGRLLNDRF